MKLILSLFTICLFLANSGVALAHGFHCHKKGADGSLTDLPDARSKSVCSKKGGVWSQHEAHCHQKTGEGKVTDLPAVHDESSCTAKGGEWKQHDDDHA
jgi:hypothetical protein